ncbi:MAG: class A beta-lactamase [Candidatus Eremiobacteraeota bacterium]|nr:class A beta-lactamase [Candidatus Eremiobacteraeota bacterium]
MNRPVFLRSLAAAVATPPPTLADVPTPPFLVQELSGRGRLGVVAIDLRDLRRIVQRSRERFPLASTFKLPLVMAVLKRVDEGTERLDRPIRFTAADLLNYSPIVAQQPHGGTLTIAQLCAAAIEHSDNAAANLLLAAVGGPGGVTAFMRRLGDPVTRLDRNEPALNTATPGDVRDTTTPEAMANLLARLVRSRVLSGPSKARLYGWLRGANTGLARIRAGVPAGWTVGDKTGTTNSGGNDVAILWPPAGPPIILAVYFAEVRGTDAERDAAIAGVARSAVRTLRG